MYSNEACNYPGLDLAGVRRACSACLVQGVCRVGLQVIRIAFVKVKNGVAKITNICVTQYDSENVCYVKHILGTCLD